MVGMVQDFSKRYPLLDGQGNWGSVDGDNAAAMRYTEIRMKKICQDILADISKETVDFVPNYDESTTEPVILPSKFPQLLVNGSAGIAVGMATSIPPHNFTEIITACLAILENKDLTDDELFELVPAPDFPTGGIICGRSGIVKAYQTGRGSLVLRAVVEEEESKKGNQLVVTELPYQVNKSELIIKIADLVKNKVVEGISNIRDESDKKGMRLVIEIKRGEIPSVVLNQLYKYTSLQTTVSFLMLALLDNKPILFTLRRMIEEFLTHRRTVVQKRTEYDLKKAQAREHIIAGLLIALENIDAVIELLKKSSSAQDAIEKLNDKYMLSVEQARSILDMKLQKLTGLEQEKLHDEIKDLKQFISSLQMILQDSTVLDKEIAKELEDLKASYGDERKTKIEGPVDGITDLDLITEEDVVVTLTRKGYIKRVPLKTYETQHRGGKGKMGMTSLEDAEDIVQDLFVTTTHGQLLFFSNFGRVYCMRAYEIPEGSRIAKGRALVNLLPLQEGEYVVKLLDSGDISGRSVALLTKQGTIKRTPGDNFVKIRCTGIRAVTLKEGDELVFCSVCDDESSIVIATRNGMGIRFKATEVRSMGRQAAGVRGIRLKADDEVMGMEVICDDRDLLFATSRGYGKRTRINDFRVAHRGGLGVRTIPTGGRNGHVIGLARVDESAEILLIDKDGKIIRISPTEVRTMGRQAAGVRLIRLDAKQELSSVVAFTEFKRDEDGKSCSKAEAQKLKAAAESAEQSVDESIEESGQDSEE